MTEQGCQPLCCARHRRYAPPTHLYRSVVNEMMFSVPLRFAKGWDLGKRRSSTCSHSNGSRLHCLPCVWLVGNGLAGAGFRDLG